MNILVEKGILTEMLCGSNLAYLLEDNSCFLPTEYKVLLNQDNSGFLRCCKMTYNGKTQLYYLTEQLQTLEKLLPGLTPNQFIALAGDLISNVIEVRNNGFLSCENVEISVDKLYVDTANFKVSMIYLPLNQKLFNDYSSFENELRTGLIRLIQAYPNLSSAQTRQLMADLANGTVSIEMLYKRLKGGAIPEKKPDPVKKEVRLVAMDAPKRFELKITKSDFVIGRSSSADGQIDFNKYVGSQHCKVLLDSQGVSLVDLHSKNYTYINKEKLLPDKAYPLHNGDIVRLANSDFQVVIPQ